MKRKIISVLFLCIGVWLFSLANRSSEGPHGGIVKKADSYFIEMKNNPDTSFYAYLLDKKFKTVSSKGISAEAKFFFTDSTTMDVQLKANAENAFTAKVTPAFYACKIIFHVSGKDVMASFEKASQVARQN